MYGISGIHDGLLLLIFVVNPVVLVNTVLVLGLVFVVDPVLFIMVSRIVPFHLSMGQLFVIFHILIFCF